MTAERNYERDYQPCTTCHTRRPTRGMEAGRCRDRAWCERARSAHETADPARGATNGAQTRNGVHP